MAQPLTIALSKGRIFKETLPLLAGADIVPAKDPEQSRELVIGSNHPDIRFLILRASDVPVYVQYGGADIGVVGKDVLMEHGGEGLYEPLDLQIACCRLMVAGRDGSLLESSQRLRIATKYVNCTEQYFASRSRQVEVIKLYGSMEIAPVTGLADLIVDVVDSGATLRANGLVPLEHIADISSRLIVNRASMKTNHARISDLIQSLKQTIRDSNSV